MRLETFVGLLERTMHLRGIRRHTIETPVGPISYHQFRPAQTEGPTVVFVHGLGNSSVAWIKCYKGLGPHTRVIGVDLPGFGGTPAPEGQEFATLPQMRDALIAFLETLDIGPAVLVGQSLGGWVSARLALKRPELVERLILVNTAGILYPQIQEQREMLLVSSREDLKSFWVRLWHRTPALNWLFAKDYIRRMEMPQVVKLLDAIVAEDFLNEELAQMKPPTAIIWGQADRFIPRQTVEVLMRELPAPQVYWIPRCGHIPQVEAPKPFLKALRGFLSPATPAAS
jgi:pimeloyl-ACP methyl ester carboxylesterase